LSVTASRATIVGVGGIGCALGYALLAGGTEVTFVESDADKLEWGASNGIVVDELPAQHPAHLVPFNAWIPQADDLIFLCTKCYDNHAVLDRVPDSVEMVPVQNGFDPELVHRVEIEGIASFVTECTPGTTHTRITRPGDLHMGFSGEARGRSLPDRVKALVDLLDSHGSFTVVRVPEVLPYKNSKLLYNAAISPIAAVAGLDNGELLTIAKARRLFFGLLRENYRILKDAGAPLERVGPFHPDTVNRLLRLPLVARILAIPFSRTLRGTYCSMAGDLPNGPTELDNYNGHLLELAGDGEVPLNRAVYGLARRIEADGSTPDPRFLDELAAFV
jgi:2-dehydropantoate 2-reductase